MVIISGSLSAYFPCLYVNAYVNAHCEDDIGLQRGKLGHKRYDILQSMWRNNKISMGVSRVRNQLEQQDLIGTSYL